MRLLSLIKMHKQSYIIPVPFIQSTYSRHTTAVWERIVHTKMANSIQSSVYSSNRLEHCHILDPISFIEYDDDKPHIGTYLRTAASMQQNLARTLSEIYVESGQYFIIGGDHTISAGTGAGLSKCLDMQKVGLIWIDAHADSNTPATSYSKCITGYPVAINIGKGPEELTHPFNGNFINSVVHIGLRDIDDAEAQNLKDINHTSFSCINVEHFGIRHIMDQTLSHLHTCDKIWLSIDIDSLDPVYFADGETDVPVVGGLTPRELLYITNRIRLSGKLLVTELTQLNDVGKDTPLTVLASRIGEIALGLGDFRYHV